jgi:hypothetical protein
MMVASTAAAALLWLHVLSVAWCRGVRGIAVVCLARPRGGWLVGTSVPFPSRLARFPSGFLSIDPLSSCGVMVVFAIVACFVLEFSSGAVVSSVCPRRRKLVETIALVPARLTIVSASFPNLVPSARVLVAMSSFA